MFGLKPELEPRLTPTSASQMARACMDGNGESWYSSETPSAGYPYYPNGYDADELLWGCMGARVLRKLVRLRSIMVYRCGSGRPGQETLAIGYSHTMFLYRSN